MTGDHDAAGLVRFAKLAEQAGFDSVWTGDSVLARMRVEPLSLLSAVAAATTRVRLGTAALIAPLRNPLLLASQAATVDQLSGGRLILGLGSGAPVPDSEREFAAVGVPFGKRGARLDDLVEFCRRTWKAGEALPPVQQDGPPVWLASGDSPRVLARVAEKYDGWLPYLPDVDAYARAWKQISDQTNRSMTAGLYATLVIDDNEPRARRTLDEYARAYYCQPLEIMSTIQAYRGGSVEACVDWLGSYVDAGASQLVLRIGSLAASEQLDVLADRVLPLLKKG